MDTNVIVAIITAGVSLIGTVITVMMANRQALAAMSEQSKLTDEKIKGKISVIETKIDELSKRIEKHNQIIERTYSLETRVSVLEKKGA